MTMLIPPPGNYLPKYRNYIKYKKTKFQQLNMAQEKQKALKKRQSRERENGDKKLKEN